jgi:hypothetical protein
MKNQLQQLLAKPMDRKDFLKHVGIMALAVTGVTGLLAALMNAGGNHNSTGAGGYGESRYGR